MARSSKHKRMKKLKRKVDRISHLPDEVLGHILSFVSTKQSVQTSVLSKRWLLVWTHVPCIDLDDSTLTAIPMVGTDQTVHTSFINFFDNAFNPRNETSISKFTLKCTNKFDLFQINRWILAATKHRVRELDICITEKHFIMSNSLFAYQELVELRLGKHFILSVPGTLSFPSLKKLHFHYIKFYNEAINKFLSSCPVLENLHLEQCKVENLDTLDINAPALKFLIVDDYSSSNYKNFILEAPNLVNFKFSSHTRKNGYCFKKLNSLVKADINVYSYYGRDPKKSKYIPYALDMVRGIAYAKILFLTDSTLRFFSLPDALDLPIFHNLTKLRLAGDKYCGLMLSQLLHNSPNLEVLVINKKGLGWRGNLDFFEWKKPSSVPECLYLHLKVVKIWGFKEQKDVGRFIRFVLLHGKVLNEFLTKSYFTSELKELKISRKRLTYLMRSKTKHAKPEVSQTTTRCNTEPKELKISEQLLTYLERRKSKK